MTISRRCVLAGALTAPAIVASTRLGSAAPTQTLKISHQFPGGTIDEGDFRDRLCRKFAVELEKRTNGALAAPMVRPPRGESAAKRRRDVVRVLLIAVGASGLLALATNFTLLWALFVIAVIALLAFFALWAWSRSVAAEQMIKVQRMPSRPGRELPLRRAASS